MVEQFFSTRPVHIECNTPRPDQAATESVPTEKCRHVKKVATQSTAVRGGRKKPNVTGQRAEVTCVIGQSFQFQRHATQYLCSRGWLAACQSFNSLTVRGCVADRRVARQRFHVMDRALVRSTHQRSLHATVLITERDFQMEYMFAMALKTEMSGLDHARMNRADSHFVHFLAFDAVKVRHADEGLFARRPAPGVVAGALRLDEADRFKPRMSFGVQAELFRNLALEQMHLRALGC